MALEVGQGNQRIVVSQGLAHRHLLEPLSALDRQHRGALGIHDIDGAERPSVHLQRLAMLVGSVAVALVVGVGLHDGGILQVLLHQRLHPFARQDVGSVLLAGVQFHGHLALDVLVHFLVSRNQSFGTEVASEIDNGFIARTLIIVHILAAIGIARRITLVRLCLLRITAGHHSSTKAQQKSSSNQFVHSFCLLSFIIVPIVTIVTIANYSFNSRVPLARIPPLPRKPSRLGADDRPNRSREQKPRVAPDPSRPSRNRCSRRSLEQCAAIR